MLEFFLCLWLIPALVLSLIVVFMSLGGNPGTKVNAGTLFSVFFGAVLWPLVIPAWFCKPYYSWLDKRLGQIGKRDLPEEQHD